MAYSPSDRKKRYNSFKHTRARRAWARVAWGNVALMKYESTEDVDKDDTEEEGVMQEITDAAGPSVRLVITKSKSRRPTTLDLTMLTEAELRALRRVFIAAFDEALTTCVLRDKEAQDAYAKGDDSFVRLYRPVPEFVDREGESRKHDPSVWDRPESVSGRDLRDRIDPSV